MNKFYLWIFVLLAFTFTAPLADPIDKIAMLVRQGNVHELSGFFAENVEVSVLDEENVYSKAQAELILDKFFSQNRPQSVKILHKVNYNANYQFGVLQVNTGKSFYRVAFTLKGSGNKLAMIEFRVEAVK